MQLAKAPKNHPVCKVIPFYRGEEGVRFGLVGRAGRGGFPEMAFPNLLAIDHELEDFGRHWLGMGRPQSHAAFVERPHPEGWLFYLLEDLAQTPPPDQREGLPRNGLEVAWLASGQALPLLTKQEKKAMAKAMVFLMGQKQ